MPFSSLSDPNDLARACRVLDSAWAKITELNLMRGDPEAERISLAYVVAGLLKSGGSDDELIEATIARFLERSEHEA